MLTNFIIAISMIESRKESLQPQRFILIPQSMMRGSNWKRIRIFYKLTHLCGSKTCKSAYMLDGIEYRMTNLTPKSFLMMKMYLLRRQGSRWLSLHLCQCLLLLLLLLICLDRIVGIAEQRFAAPRGHRHRCLLCWCWRTGISCKIHKFI